MRNLFLKATKYLEKMRHRRLWMILVSCLACVVVFCTTYALILPAITLESSKYKPNGHTHTDECYQIIKTDEIKELNCPFEHIHTSDCYDEEDNLICGLEEYEYVVHTHDDYCYDADGNLVCTLPAIEKHTHTEECYDASGELICDKTDEVEHQHTDDCYTLIQEASEEKVLDCPYAKSDSEEEVGEETENIDSSDDDSESPANSDQEDTIEDGENNSNEDNETEGKENSARVYTSENDTLSIEVVLGEETEIPTDAVLRVKAVTEEDINYDYALLKEQAEESIGRSPEQIDFYDISFYTAEGEYVLVEDTADVTLRFKENGYFADAEEVAVLHYKEGEELPTETANIQKEIDEDDAATLSFQTEGFSLFAVMSLTAQEPEPQAEGDNVLGLDGKSFAIVNQAGGNYALTATSTKVNTVDGLSAQTVSVTQSEDTYKIVGYVTAWTFHKQDDGTYRVSTSIVGTDGIKSTKYLCLCKEPFDASNIDGRGSLTLADTEDEASKITVTPTDDGLMIFQVGNSYINSDSSTHNFWCYNSGDSSEYSKHRLCEIEEPNYDKSYWAIVNIKSNQSIAMEAGGVSGNENGNRKGTSVKVEVVDDSRVVRSYQDITQWYFEKQEDGTYYISNTVTMEDGTSDTKYLSIGDSAVTLSSDPMKITLTPGVGSYAGMYRLTNEDGMAINLFGGSADRGFGSYNDSSANEWLTLCKVNRGTNVIENTANHPSSVINLFDYWITNQDDADNVQADINSGINAGHDLKFVHKRTDLTGYNKWTGNAGVYPEIVQNTLGEDGYPVLAVDSQESLNYLFDPSYEGNNYRTYYRNTSGLLQTDAQGYYYYNSAKNFAEFDKVSKEFTLYDTWGVYSGGASGIKGQFFPFNKMENVMNASSTDAQINHYFGLTLTTRFVQQYGGHTNSSRKTKTVFNFSGDDDVWIYIDGVLVADLGGIHDKSSVSIDFSTGNVTINEGTNYESTQTLKQLFANAGIEAEWSDTKNNTFKDSTYHTLKFFYLERGNTDSDLYLQYNLTEIPATGIYKVNQYGEVLGGAEFSVYKANANYEITDTTPVYTGITDDSGQMIFTDKDDMPYSLNELKSMFGEHFVLRETQPPENYSLVSDDIHLFIQNGLLLCDNTYDSGVWSSPTLMVTAPNELKSVTDNDNPIPYYDLNSSTKSNGTLFAVVLKYVGDSSGNLTQQKNWAPVYGSDEKGYNVVPVDGNESKNFIQAAITAAKEQQSDEYGNCNVCFGISANGAMQLEFQNIPGNILNYYYVLGDEEKDKTQYTIGYYWTEASSLDKATSANTVRVDADDATYKFDRVFGATIEVPNLINRLFAQKLNEEGTLVNGATFAMYPVKETDGKIYYTSGDTLIYLEPDKDGNNKGVATLKDGTTCAYEVDSQTGNIEVGESNADGGVGTVSYTIKPYKTAITLPAASDDNTAHEDGTASFSGIANNNYYLREIAVPKGYKLNSTEVMVKVADNAVYANAGKADDGVTVARGPGYLVSTLSKFASDGDVDNTLTWVYEQMRISGESNTFSAYDDNAWENWKYLKENVSAETAENEKEAYTTYLTYDPPSEGEVDSDTLFNFKVNKDKYKDVLNWNPIKIDEVRRRLYTTVGWSYYELYQDYEYGVKASEGANYTPVVNEDDGALKEIANLFSRSTYVQVTDEKIEGNLRIHKIVKNVPEGHANDSYSFTITLKDKNGNALGESYEIYEIQTGENGVEQESAFKNSDGDVVSTITNGDTITLTNDQLVVIKNLPAGTKYVVTETSSNTYKTSSIRDQGKDPVGTGTGEEKFQNEVNGTLYWSVVEKEDGTTDLDATSTVDFTNVYPSKLTLNKVDSTNQENKLSGAEFVLYRKEADDNKLYYSNTTGTAELTEWNSLDGGKKEEDYALETKDGTISFSDIYDGDYYLKELKAPDGYKLLENEIILTVKDGKLIQREGEAGVTIGEDQLTLTVPNNTGYALPNTGGHGTKLYIYCGLLLMAGALMCEYIRKSKKERRLMK